MEWWIKEEIEKYKGKKVIYLNCQYTVVEVFWRKNSEDFIYYIEDAKKNLKKVFESNIKLC